MLTEGQHLGHRGCLLRLCGSWPLYSPAGLQKGCVGGGLLTPRLRPLPCAEGRGVVSLGPHALA